MTLTANSDCPSQYTELRVDLQRSGADYSSRVYFAENAGHRPMVEDSATDVAPFQIPVEQWEVEAVISRLVVKQSRNIASETSDPAKALGSRLFDAVLGKDGKRLYAGAAAARESDRGLCISISSDDPEIQDLPWELMYDRDVLNHFVGLAPATSVLRRGTARAAQPRPTADVKVVVVSTEPETDETTAGLAGLMKASGLPSQSLVVLKADGWDDLKKQVMDHSPTLLHILGSGQTARRGGQRLQIHRKKETQNVSASQLGEMLLTLADLQLVTFHGQATDRLASAMSAVVPVSVGFRELVSPPLVLAFLREFYTGLWRGLAVPSAVTAGRSHVVIQSQGGSDWAAPVVVSSTLGPLVVPNSVRRFDDKGAGGSRRTTARDAREAAESISTLILRRSLRIDEENRAALEASWSTVPTESRPSFVISQSSDLDGRIRKARSELRRSRAGRVQSPAGTPS